MRTHLPKPCRQVESEGAQLCGHEGELSSRQLEQEVCWHGPWQATFPRDTDLRTKATFGSLKDPHRARQSCTRVAVSDRPCGADLCGVSLAELPGAVRLAAFCLCGLDHCRNKTQKHPINKRNLTLRSVQTWSVKLTAFLSWSDTLSMTAKRFFFFQPKEDKRCDSGFTVSRTL